MKSTRSPQEKKEKRRLLPEAADASAEAEAADTVLDGMVVAPAGQPSVRVWYA